MNSILHISNVNDAFLNEKCFKEEFEKLIKKYDGIDNLKANLNKSICAPGITSYYDDLSNTVNKYNINNYFIAYKNDYKEFLEIDGFRFYFDGSNRNYFPKFFRKYLEKWAKSTIKTSEDYHDYNYYENISYSSPIDFYLDNRDYAALSFVEYMVNLFDEKDFNLYSAHII